MPEKYKSIYGYFDFEPIYDWAIEHYPNGRFVELGTWLGKSTCYMGEALKEANSRAKFYGVDTFLGESGATDQQDIVTKEGGSIYRRFLLNMKEAGVLDYVTPLKLNTVEAADLFDDESLDFIFLDASHLKQDVLNDLNAWWPKLKKGGLFGGHDYYIVPNTNLPTEVKQAVDEFFSERIKGLHCHNISFLLNKD
jgi:predicted O-methyltransferase YrrM